MWILYHKVASGETPNVAQAGGFISEFALLGLVIAVGFTVSSLLYGAFEIAYWKYVDWKLKNMEDE